MDDKNNLLEKLGIVAKKEETPKRKASYSPRPTAKPVENPALSNKYSSDDLAMEYEQMLKERAAMAKQIKDLEAKASAVSATPTQNTVSSTTASSATKYSAPKPVETVAPKPVIEAPKASSTSYTTEVETTDTSYCYHDTESFSSVADIYATQGKDLNGVNTVYVVDSFVKTLPDTLTDSVKRDVLLRILNVSNISVDELVADGNARLNILSSYSNDFKDYTKEYVSSRAQEVSILEDQIKTLKREIMERNKIQAKQQAEIAAETAKISNNMIFITKDKAGFSAE